MKNNIFKKLASTNISDINLSSLKLNLNQLSISTLISLVSVLLLMGSIVFAGRTLLKINQPPPQPEEGQLLNLILVNRAATLIQEETIQFDIEF